MNRRQFLQFLGISGVITTLPGCSSFSPQYHPSEAFPELKPGLDDQLSTISGIDYKILIRWGDKINSSEHFGFNNDFISFHQLSDSRSLLWVNHEYVNPIFIGGSERNKANIKKELSEVGGSILEIERNDNNWDVKLNSEFNRRLDGNTKIPFAWNQEIGNSNFGLGTVGNCAGGKTPWGTFLTCEENYDMFWGDFDRQGRKTDSWLKWDKYYPRSPEHYGWVVEVEPASGAAKKLISMGRFAHECATVIKTKKGKVIAYSGDDCANEHLYKFISDSSNSLEKGKLYVANLEQRKWLSLNIEDQEILRKKFKNQTEIQIYTREAAKLVGATPLDRPEDIEIDPLTGNVLIALTNNKSINNYHGSILKIMEDNNEHESLTFKYDNFLTGGKKHGFSCPDNMVFDPQGNLWFTTDMSGDQINQGHYQGYGNNSLFVFIRSGSRKGEVIRIANAPIDAEFTGPCFSPDYKTLFLSVQHPGEMSKSLQKLTSNWPDGSIPKSAVIYLKGPLLDKIISGDV